MKHVLAKLCLLIGLVFLLLSFLFYTNPQELPLFFLFVPFVLLYIIMFIVFKQVGAIFLKNVSIEYRRWIVGFVALLPVGLLLTMSAGQTDGNDVILFGIFVVLIIFYFSRTNFLK